ncbi:MAG: DEAD/DEAH box helicase [Phycisphaerales bacterium]
MQTLIETTVPAAEATGFSRLGLHPLLLEALAAEGYEQPTAIQAQAIPPALAGRDILGIAQTGTGKTAAFALPILHRLIAAAMPGSRPPAGRKPRVLVLSPTRELASQIGESFATYGRRTPLRGTVVFGGVGQGPQVNAISRGIDILVATPGRLLDLMGQGLVDLSSVECFVLDEADRMLDMGFIDPIRRIASAIPTRRRTMLFSATMPAEIERLAGSLLSEPAKVSVTPESTTVERISQRLHFVLKARKTSLLLEIFEKEPVDLALVFTKTKHGADRVVKQLRAAGISSEAIHGNRSQGQRTRALEAFRSGRSPVLVATDIAARGLDVDGITHVINYDLPMEPEAYVHRIGRTARAGASGIAVSFCDETERGLLRDIERVTRQRIPRADGESAEAAERIEDRAPRGDHGGARGGSRGGRAAGARGGSPRGNGGGGRGGKRSQGQPRESASKRSGGGSPSRAGASQAGGSSAASPRTAGKGRRQAWRPFGKASGSRR